MSGVRREEAEARRGARKKRGWSSDLSFLARSTERYIVMKGWQSRSSSVGRREGSRQRLDERKTGQRPTSSG